MLFRRTSNVVEEKEESLEEPEQYKLGLGGVARSLSASRKPVSWPAATKNGTFTLSPDHGCKVSTDQRLYLSFRK